MSKKKVFLLVVSLMLIMGLLPNVVSAQEGSGIGEGLGSAFETIRELFGFLPELITSDKLMSGEPGATFWAKFLIWILLFSVTYFGAGFVFKDNKNITIVVAIAISLMGALLIPDGVVFSIFQTYGFVAAVVVWIVPLAAGIYLAHKTENKFMRAIIYILAAVILGFINAGIMSNWGDLGTKAFPYFSLLMAITIWMAIWNIIGIVRGSAGQDSFGNKFLDVFRGGGGGDRGNFPEPEGFFGRRRERGRERDEATERERQAQEQSVSIEAARAKLTQIKASLDGHRGDTNQEIRQRFNNIAILLQKLREAQQALDVAETEIGGRARGMGGGLPIDKERDRYDELVRNIMDDLKRIIDDLIGQKQMLMKARKAGIERSHQTNTERFMASKAEYEANKEAKNHPQFEKKKEDIDRLEERLKGLLNTDIKIEGREDRSYIDYQNAFSVTIRKLNDLLNYIHKNSGAGRGFLFIRSNKGRRRHLPVRAIYDVINQLFTEIMKREEEEELNDRRYTAFEINVNNATAEIFRKLGEITGLKLAIPRTRTGLAVAAVKRGGKNIGKGIKQANAGVNTGLTKEYMAEQATAAAVGNVIGQVLNPLGRFASRVGKNAKNLLSKEKKGKDTIPEQEEAASEEPLAEEVEKRVNVLRQFAQGIKNFDPQKSDKLMRLANGISVLENRIFSGLKRLRIPGLTRTQAEEITEDIVGTETRMQRAIMEAVATKPTGITKKWVEDWLKKLPKSTIEQYFDIIGRLNQQIIKKRVALKRTTTGSKQNKQIPIDLKRLYAERDSIQKKISNLTQ